MNFSDFTFPPRVRTSVTKVRFAPEQNGSNWSTRRTVDSGSHYDGDEDDGDADADDDDDGDDGDGDADDDDDGDDDDELNEGANACVIFCLDFDHLHLNLHNFQFTIFDGGEPTKSRSLLQDRQDETP